MSTHLFHNGSGAHNTGIRSSNTLSHRAPSGFDSRWYLSPTLLSKLTLAERIDLFEYRTENPGHAYDAIKRNGGLEDEFNKLHARAESFKLLLGFDISDPMSILGSHSCPHHQCAF